MKGKKRSVEISVISDLHLGTYGCHARELLKYLRSIKPGILVLNGDIIDMWQFKKRYWPKPHMKVVRYLLGLATKGTKVYYITGNHDETLRKFSDISLGNFEIVDKLELSIDDKQAWIFHGDVFDVIMQHSKWLAKLGAVGYDSLIMINVIVNRISQLFGKGKVSLSKKVKDNVKSALKYIDDFEQTAARMAINKGFDYVICGHIHKPAIKTVTNQHNQSIEYLNSGDWIENLSALEYNKKEWRIYHYSDDKELNADKQEQDDKDNITDLNNKEVFQKLLEDFQK